MPSGSAFHNYNGTKKTTIYDVVTGKPLYSYATSLNSGNFSWQRASQNTPGYPKTKRTNAFTYTKSRMVHLHGLTEVYSNGKLYITYDGVVTGTANGLLDGSPASEEAKGRADRKMVGKLLDRIKDQKVNLAVAAAERKQTVRMCLSLASNISNAAPLIRDAEVALNTRGKKGLLKQNAAARKLSHMLLGSPGIKGKAKHLSNLVLQVQYGWKPLIADIQGSAETVAELEQNRPTVRRTLVKESVDLNFSIPKNEGTYGKQTGKYEVTGYVRFMVTPSKPLTMTGFTNPAHLLWEAATLSFVADWVFDIGSYLGRMDADVGITFIDGGKTTFEKRTVETVVEQDGPNSRSWHRGSKEFLRVQRLPWADCPAPPKPDLKNPFSLPHSVSALALITQRLK